jgi:2-polyprenyl-6-methoxyphenol hydroxylase-like FAD-dependent oxidoreductase
VYSYEDRIRAVQLYLKLGKRIRATIRHLGYAPSLLSGQGSSLALVGAYVLAGELATHADPADAFASYERIARPFMAANQALASRKGGSLLMPRTQEELDARNATLAAMQDSGKTSHGDHASRVHNALTLPDYTQRLRDDA